MKAIERKRFTREGDMAVMTTMFKSWNNFSGRSRGASKLQRKRGYKSLGMRRKMSEVLERTQREKEKKN